jgi:hypothetical protein
MSFQRRADKCGTTKNQTFHRKAYLMSNSPDIEASLAIADRHISDACRAIAAQRDRVRQWKRWGADSKSAEELLQLMEQTLAQFLVHRKFIVDDISRLHEQNHQRDDRPHG